MSTGGEPSIKGKKGPKKRQEADGVTPEMEALVPEPATVASVPTAPWGLYTHFCKVVKHRWPDAVLANRSPAILKWGKDLLSRFQPENLYEMIEVLVRDYEHIEHGRFFFKFKGGPTPTFQQLYCNADLIATFVGKGIASGGKSSGYLEDYRRRHGGAGSSGPISTNEDLIRRLEAASDDDPTRVAK